MKKLLTYVLFASTLPVFAQLPVSQTPEKKNVVLEEFTGTSCTYCPDGHKIAQQIKDANPKDVVVINIHQGSFAGSNPNYKTSFGDALAKQAAVGGYPTGSVSRVGSAVDRGTWKSKATTIMGQASYVNVAMQAVVNPTTREMIVDVEMYFTAAGAASVNLNVALLQNNVLGPQTGGSTYNPSQMVGGKYNHMHMLRHFLTGQWGEAITSTKAGELVKKQYKYTLPANINNVVLDIKNLEVAVFVAEGQKNIITGTVGAVTMTTSANDMNKLVANNISIYPNPAQATSNISFTLDANKDFQMEIYNALGNLVYTKKPENLNAGQHTFSVDTYKFSAGLYFATISIGNEVFTRKINIVK